MNKVRPIANGESARLLTIVSSLYLVFVFYGSWVPLHFVPRPLADMLHEFSSLPFADQRIESATDWATNFLLLAPLSFLWAQRILPDHRGLSSLFVRLLLIALGIALAFVLEFSQLYFPPRVVSQKDVLALGLGVVVGIAAQFRWGLIVENWLNMLWQHESHKARVVRLLHVYLLVLFVFNMLPLDLTLSVVELYHKWREGRVILVPFGGLKDGLLLNIYAIATDALAWVPVGIFLALDRKTSLLRVAVSGLLLSAFFEAAQLLVYSRVTDTTDVVLAGLGSISGGLLVTRCRNFLQFMTDAQAGFWTLLWVAWVILILGVFWFPYDFSAAEVTPDTVLAALTRVPFLLLYQGSEFQAINELLRKIGFFLPLGVFWGLRGRALRKESAGVGLTPAALVVLTIIPLIVEGGQLLMPGKFADLTDVILEACGGLLGIVLVRWVLAGSRAGSYVPHAVQPSTAESPPRASNRELSPSRDGLAFSPPISHILTFAGLVVTIGVATRLPMLPYNIREINAPGTAGLLTTLGLAMAVYWIANGHFLFLKWSGQTRLLMMLPVWLLVHGGVAWVILRLSVPIESIHDIVGAPVLDWPWELELIARYLALHAIVALQAVGAILLMLIICRRGQIATLLIWAMCTLLLAWPLHLFVVDYAATDNLTELMRQGGSFSSSIVLATGFLAFFLSGALIAAFLAFPGERGKVLVLILLSTLAATAAFWWGSEQVVMKYGKVFSAWQFLLSTNRQHYVEGTDLLLRYFAAYAAMACVLGLTQLAHVHSFARNTMFRVRQLPQSEPV